MENTRRGGMRECTVILDKGGGMCINASTVGVVVTRKVDWGDGLAAGMHFGQEQYV